MEDTGGALGWLRLIRILATGGDGVLKKRELGWKWPMEWVTVVMEGGEK